MPRFRKSPVFPSLSLGLGLMASLTFGCSVEMAPETKVESTQQLLVQPSRTEARYFSVGADQSISLFRDWNYSRNWFRVLPLELGQAYTSLLFYDRTGGSAKLYHTIGDGNLQHVRDYSGWRKWDEVVPVRLSSSQQGVFYYDRDSSGKRLGRLYRVNNTTGELIHLGDQDLSESANPRGFDAMAAGYFSSSPSTGTQDIIAYDKDSGTLTTLVKGSAGMVIETKSASVGRHWDQLIVGNFVGGSRTDVLLYDRDFGRAALFENSDGSFTKSHEQQTWPSAEHRVFVVGQFGGSSYDDLLVYDGRNHDPSLSGQGAFYINDGTGSFTTPTKVHTGWRTTWGMIIPGHFDDTPRDDLLFYENTYFLKLTVIQPSDGTSTRTTTDAKVRSWADSFNRAYATASLYISEFERITVTNEFLWEGYCSMPSCSAPDCYDYGIVKSKINNWVKNNRPNDLVIVLPNGGSSACSSASVRFAWASGSADEALVMHELGHYFHLAHAMNEGAHGALRSAFHCGNNIDEERAQEILGGAVSSLSSLDPDFRDSGGWDAVHDTPADPGPYYFANAGIDRCTYAGAKKSVIGRNAAGNILYRTNPEPKNFMSYYLKPGFPNCSPAFDSRCDRENMTPGQGMVAREVIRNARNYLIQ